MSHLLRGFWNDPWEGVNHPSRICGQHFGNIVPSDYFTQNFVRPPCPRVPPLLQQTGKSEVMNSEDEFRINMDVQHFKPEEISIKTKDNRLIISAQHDKRPDEHGFIKREFTRQYFLPKNVDPCAVTSILTTDGILTLKAPKVSLEAPTERKIPITYDIGDKDTGSK